MAKNENDDELISRVAGIIEERTKKAYREGYEAGCRVGWAEAKACLKSMVDNFAVDGSAPAATNHDANSFNEFVADVLAAIRQREMMISPDGITPEDLGMADLKRVRQAFRHLTMTGQIRRVEKGRYLPVENEQPQAEIAAE